MPKVDWLDRLTFREIEVINEQQKRESNFLYLMIEFPRIVCDSVDYTVVYFEKVHLVLFIFLKIIIIKVHIYKSVCIDLLS